MEVKTTRLSLFDGMELKEATFRKQVFPEHFHDAYSIGIIEHGIESLSITGKDIQAHANSIVIINPYDVHANSFFDNDSWKYRTMYISTEAMRYVQKQSGLPIKSNVYFPKQLINDALLFQQLLNFHISGSNDSVLLEQLLSRLITQYAISKPEVDHTMNQPVLTDAVHFIDSNFSERIIVADIAGRWGMDKYKFIRAFRKQTGLTPNAYLLLQRINKAKQLIACDMPMTDVALETGFYDQSHFNHYFRKYIGISPLAYRKGLSVV